MGFGDDAIRIQVGVASNVKAGMDSVVKDINSAKPRIEAIGKDSGKGFAEAFGKVLRGDISGAVEDVQRKLAEGGKKISAVGLVWGAGIATALVAGVKAGIKLDEMFGISDKIGNALAKQFGTQEDELLRIKVEGLKRRRQAEEKHAAEVAELIKPKLDDVAAFQADDETGREWKKRIEDQEKERIESEKRVLAAKERAFDIESEWAGMIAKERENAALGAAARGGAIVRADIGALGAAANKADADAEAAWGQVHQSGKKSQEWMIAQAEAARARGIRGKNIDAVLAAAEANRAANNADKALADAQMQQAKDIADIAKNTAALPALVTMK
jgi:hypothetical protein